MIARMLAAFCMLCTILGGACAGEGAPGTAASGARWVAQVATASARADAALADHDLAAARSTLREAIAAAPTRDVAPEDARAVHADLSARLAAVELRAGAPREALQVADEALALGAPPLFMANLWVVRGAAHEALGDPSAAASDYHQALVLNEAELDRILEEGKQP